MIMTSVERKLVRVHSNTMVFRTITIWEGHEELLPLYEKYKEEGDVFLRSMNRYILLSDLEALGSSDIKLDTYHKLAKIVTSNIPYREIYTGKEYMETVTLESMELPDNYHPKGAPPLHIKVIYHTIPK